MMPSDRAEKPNGCMFDGCTQLWSVETAGRRYCSQHAWAMLYQPKDARPRSPDTIEAISKILPRANLSMRQPGED